MAKIILALLISIILATPLYAWGPATFAAGTVSAAASACNTTIPSSSNTRLSATPDGELPIGSEAARYYVGQVIPTSGSHTICKVAWRLGPNTGDVSAVTLYSQIWSMSGANLNTLVAESATTVTNPAGNEVVEFTHNTSINGTYAVVITMKGLDASKYATVQYFTSDKDSYSYYGRWNSSKVEEASGASFDVRGQFYE